MIRPFKTVSPDGKRIIVLGLAILYILTFPTVYSLVGNFAIVFSAIPLAASVWHLGWFIGILAGILSIGANIALYSYVTASRISDEAIYNIFIPGLIILVVVGLVVGQLHSMMRERETMVKQLHTRQRFLAVSNMITTNIISRSNSPDLYDMLALQLTNLLVAESGFITEWNKETNQTQIVASTLPSKEFDGAIPESSHLDFTLSVMNSGLPCIIDMPDSGQVVIPEVLGEMAHSVRTAIVIPLSVKEYKFGTATLTFHARTNFSDEEIDLITLMGRNVALALRTIRQEKLIKGNLRELEALSKIERALSETERVGLRQVLQLIVESARELIPGTDGAIIHLMDEERETLIPKAFSGTWHPPTGQLRMRSGNGVAGLVIKSGEVINIPDVELDARFISLEQPTRFRSLMVAPVQSSQGRLGTISVYSREPNSFTESQKTLLSSLGLQASIAIENARLLETTRQSLREVNALYRVTQKLASSLDTSELMRDVVKLLHEVFGYYHVQIFLFDTEIGDLVAQEGSGVIGAQLMNQKYRILPGQGVIGQAAETGQPIITNDAQNSILFAQDPLFPDIQSEMAIPLKTNGRTLGVLSVKQEPPNRLAERDLQIATTVADQLAVTLHKASLYSDLQAALAQEKTIRSQLVQSERLALVGRLLASVSHELNNPLQAIQNALYLLKEERIVSEQGQRDLEIVLSETERMASLIDRLRDTYRPAREEDFHPVQLNSIIEDVFSLMETHLHQNKISFVFHPDPNLPFFHALPDQICQVLLNLFINAVESMPNGGQLTVSTSQPDRNEILLTVSDNGLGIDAAILPHIFDAFVTDKESGTGLGLAITYDIVHRHNGGITAQNNPNGGATFTIRFPSNG